MTNRALIFSAVVIAVSTNIAISINSMGRNPFAPRYVLPEPASLSVPASVVPIQQTGAEAQAADSRRVVGQRPFSPEMYRP